MDETPSGPWPNPSAADAKGSLLMADLDVVGEIISAGSVEIHGKVLGKVRAPEVLVAPSGYVEGSVSAFDLTVRGAVNGTVAARQVSLAATAVVETDITHVRIAIEAGAQVEGRLIRKT